MHDFFSRLNVQLFELQTVSPHFDQLTQFVVYHEIAHAYVGQFTSRNFTDTEERAFEYIVDLVATTWIYNKMVRLTPDTPAYRSYRGIETHSECIRQNSQLVLMNQLLTLLFFAFGAAVNTNGIITLQGSTSILTRYSVTSCR